MSKHRRKKQRQRQRPRRPPVETPTGVGGVDVRAPQSNAGAPTTPPPELVELSERAQHEQKALSEKEFPRFWPHVLEAIGGRSAELHAIRGASGVPHPLIAAAIDEHGQRLLVVSAENDARAAALAQADLQAAAPDLKVIVTRPVLVSTQDLALALAKITGRVTIGTADIAQLPQGNNQQVQAASFEPLGELIAPWVNNARSLRDFNLWQGVQQLLEQLAAVKWGDNRGRPSLDLTQLFGKDPGIGDQIYGTCAFPVHSLSPGDLETIDLGSDRDEIRAILRRHDVLQYFYPPADHLALGLVDRGVSSSDDVTAGLAAAPQAGLELAIPELVPADTSLAEIIDALADAKLASEGELEADDNAGWAKRPSDSPLQALAKAPSARSRTG